MHHGIPLEDPYRWLQERDNPEVRLHLEAENAYTKQLMEQAGNLPQRLYEELVGRIEEESESAPYRKEGYLYKSRTIKDRNYREYLRKPENAGEWEIYFDANAEAAGSSYFSLGFLDVAPGGNLLAYTVDLEGDEAYTLRFRDLGTGQDLPLSINAVSPDGEWNADGSAFYFLRETESRRPYQIYRLAIFEDAKQELVYQEADEQFFAGIYKSQDGKYLFACSESNETTEISWLDLANDSGDFKVFQPRRQDIQYWLEHQDGVWLIRSNDEAPDFKLIQIAVDAGPNEEPEVLVPAREGIRLTDVLPLRRYRILFETRSGLNHVRIQNLLSGIEHELDVPDEVYELDAGNNEEFDVDCLQFVYSSPIRPAVTYSYNLETQERRILKQVRVPSGHDPEKYTTRRVLADSKDGTQVPMTFVHRKDLDQDGSAPAFLYGYGSYGSPESAAFNPLWLTWMERGIVVAVAHVRGGGLLGEAWYKDGKLQHKQNTFHDFIACASYLVDNKLTSSKKLAIKGGSAGGLLVGAVLNMRPDLFKAAVAVVPFVDVINTMLDPSLPLTTHEYEEWGDPADEAAFRSMLEWSPCDRVVEQPYPAILATAGWNDPRVSYWEAAKWVARLREASTSQSPILLKTDISSGHSGPSGRYSFLRETAMEQAFLLWQLGE